MGERDTGGKRHRGKDRMRDGGEKRGERGRERLRKDRGGRDIVCGRKERDRGERHRRRDSVKRQKTKGRGEETEERHKNKGKGERQRW